MSVLQVKDVSIRYITGDFKEIGLKEYIMRRLKNDYHITEFWADRDISFSLEKGDMLGIIGTNGAGKSTLLKAIAGIMDPTKGYVQREGTVAALLELSSGFDGDLTVRENAYLRGAMLGYTRKFMDDTYAQIIRFAELEEFQDRPFRQLSSGMKSRLAFSIASLVHPDILILDEVLSVGDGAFQEKSAAKMREIIQGGAATILVSHSLNTIRGQCNKILWLHKGKQIAFGDNVDEICDSYENFLKTGEISIECKQTEHENTQQKLPTTAPQRPDTKKKQIQTQYPPQLLAGLFLLNVIFLPITIASLMFFFGISVQGWFFPCVLIGSAGLTFLLNGKKMKSMWVVFLALVGMGAVFLLCARTYDFSWDGNTYHKSIVGLLNDGWNPLHQTFYSYAEKFPFLSHEMATWYDAYPKGSELWAATVYAAFGNIEIGKAYNLLSVIALFLVCWAFLNEIKVLKNWQSILCATFFAVNPIILIQSLVYYNDGFLWEMLLLFLIALTYLTFYEKGKYKNICYLFILLSISVGFNTKFSSVIFFGLIGFCFFGFWLIESIHKYGFKCGWNAVSNRFFVLAGSVIWGFCFIGSSSYIINILRHGNPFYTMIGEGSTEMITAQIPVSLKQSSNFVRFVVSLFSVANNQQSGTEIEWKLPFTFYQKELSQLQVVDTRIAGWGCFFSGVFLLSVVYLAIYLIRNRKKEKRFMKVAFMLSFLAFVAVIFVPGLFWARYFVGLVFIPAVAAVLLCKNMNECGSVKAGILFGVIFMSLYLDITPAMVKNLDVIQAYETSKTEIAQLKYLTETTDVKIWDAESDYHFPGRFFNLMDAGILNYEYGELSSENTASIFPEYQIIYECMPNERLSEYISGIDLRENLIFITAKDEASSMLSAESIEAMRDLGLEFDMENSFRSAYLAVINGTEIYEEKSDKMISYNTEIEGIQVSIQSAGYTEGNIGSIQLDGVEYSKNNRGLNIVIYNRKQKQVVDSIFVDLYKEEWLRR